MNIACYIKRKYKGRANALLAVEASAFGIPYPLQSGWLQRYAKKEIGKDTACELVRVLRRIDTPSAKEGVHVLSEYLEEDKVMWVNLDDYRTATEGLTLEQQGQYFQWMIERWESGVR